MITKRVILSVAVMMAGMLTMGCSLSHHVPTRPPAGMATSDVARDERACEALAAHPFDPRHPNTPNIETRYAACMLVRGYVATIEWAETGFLSGVTQTRVHVDARTAWLDLKECDRVADGAKNAMVIPLTAAQEASLAHLERAHTFAYDLDVFTGRPKAARALVACLGERGFSVTPWVRFQEGGR